MNFGTLFVVSAPSGAGKTTILKLVMARVRGLAFSVSHTTRKKRTGEEEGKDYHFVSPETFTQMRQDQAFLEWARVHDNFYGTSRAAINDRLEAGLDIILDIDVQGAGQVRTASGVNAISIFILPPSLVELEKRLRGRGTETESTIELRLTNAKKEIADADRYDHVIINDSIEETVDMVRAVIMAARSRNRRDAAGRPLEMPI